MKERLQKYMAKCGVASRRKCEEIILQGRVKVNDKVVNELGCKVDGESDKITVDNKGIKPEGNKVYIALNKPEGYVSTVKDEKGRKTIIDLVQVKERVYPIGRLDYDTSGLILLTNDGEIYNKIIHPREEKKKTYIAVIKGIPLKEDIEKFRNGVDIDGYITAPAVFQVLRSSKECVEVKIIIHEGKNRQIRRMCEAIGHPVLTLKRIQIGTIKLGNLSKGKWRFLTEEEINYLKTL
ncbi:rRNA pseudouridine synthase [Clostridiaceae bacterium UIB06]|uniref:Pseudouridine synthase n=1 Tax=Clostridium thailandense TaxID=2794346 RepID=A0A949TZV0_9CLOT|nr:pseudouridine synthase [Clostridium thailandense]MBV7274846.1 rRNA pseudouridine synthase [Clostridium thailandense]MCH5137591.1 rRNA pseudouridine synthase [Clostridiaceae bacterium UIB06]